jgi:cysteine desulfurase
MRNPFKNFGREKSVVLLDYASTTPVAPEVLSAMLPYFSDEWANPSAVYASGVRNRRVVEEARTAVARLLHIRPEGVLFTSGGTESNNQALIGLIEALHDEGRAYEDMEIITTRIEHPSILETCEALHKRGVHLSYLTVTDEGLIRETALAAALTPKTVLVTCAYVNSEVGVVQDVKKITRQVRLFNAAHHTAIRVHLDASQAPLWLSCEMDMLGVDLMTLDAGKCYGPKGVGVLALRHEVPLTPLMFGGGQERGLRSGTENVPPIVGCAAALIRAQGKWRERSEKVAVLRDYMIREIEEKIPTAVLNGSKDSRVSNNVHISIPGIESEFAVITLDSHHIAASTRSACGSGASHGSYVVRAMTNDEARATSTIRFTLGETTTKSEIEYAVGVLIEHVTNMQTFAEKLQKSTV